MGKTINVRMTRKRAEGMGYEVRPGFSLGLVPVNVNTDAMSPAGAFVVDHITSTYIEDEARDIIGISAIAGFTMQERDEKDWRYTQSDDFRQHVAALAAAYGADYTDAPMQIDEISFPIFGKSHHTVEALIEETVNHLRRAGAVALRAKNGDVIQI